MECLSGQMEEVIGVSGRMGNIMGKAIKRTLMVSKGMASGKTADVFGGWTTSICRRNVSLKRKS